jgi:hypothetical protein
MGQVLKVLNTSTPTPSITPTRTKTSTMTVTMTATITHTPTLVATSTKEVSNNSLAGKWERHRIVNNSAATEVLMFNEDGTYHIETTFDKSGKSLASMDGKYTFNNKEISFIDANNHSKTESYAMVDTGDTLILNNEKSNPWKRAD